MIQALSAALSLPPAQRPGDRPGRPAAEETQQAPGADRVVLSAAARLSADEQLVVAQLVVTDRKVRAHEQAHLAAAGGYAKGGPSYTYAVGPDGQLYAVAGEVSIDTSAVPDDPEATIRKARIIQAAANAPADPSSADRQVAAAAAQLEQAARLELAEKRRLELQSKQAGAYSAGAQPEPSRVLQDLVA